MTGDPEIHDWRTEWLAQPTTGNTNAADIRHLAVKQQRRLRAWHVAVLLALGGGLLTVVVAAAAGAALVLFAWRMAR